MNGSINQIIRDLAVYALNEGTNRANIVLALPSIYLPLAVEKTTELSSRFKLASQDISQFNNFGAYTGEISAVMLKEFAVCYSIVGHSERRVIFNESGSILLNKIENALLNNIIPIFCIGEDKVLRDSGSYADFLVQQLELLLQIKAPITNLVIAYEPIWAIGTGIVPSLDQINEIMLLITTFVKSYLNHVLVTVVYGGSVSAKNARDILDIAAVGGVLVGGASLKSDDFTKICCG